MIKVLEEIQGKRIRLTLDEFVPENNEKGYVPAVLYHIVLNGSNKIIGHCSARIGWNETMYYCGHVGYSINEEYRGNGFAVEAVNLVKEEFKINGMNFVYITNRPDNNASVRVCEKLGAKFVKLMEFKEEDLKNFATRDSFKNIWKLKF